MSLDTGKMRRTIIFCLTGLVVCLIESSHAFQQVRNSKHYYFGGTITTSRISSPSTISSLSSSSTRLFANSKNIRAAMEATEMYGIYSPEARLAWEVVEEFDSRDNSNAYTGDPYLRMSDEQMAHLQAELQATLNMMYQHRMAFQHNDMLMKDVAAELQAIKLSPPEKKPAPQIPGLWDAKLKAKALTQQFGTHSTEARLAWEEVEEIASSGLHNAVRDQHVSQPQLIKAAEACMALEELHRFLHGEQGYASY
eukprot:CAMPEP_0202454324 /NCGR_PEP_ID=MMETSP1360-20130828/12091_1 /ASSEMBLY_ACC=CAM_ASM_000848 /TAXON_ID=515479 /ORGANISM="Licmophora paradoxa, Strain CCMP2313" /LENGTH=252 /DNA_ID=CAMNT_0049073619 /DNA_START=40 /DNA_END=798 /DNA_ORIENTATION=+